MAVGPQPGLGFGPQAAAFAGTPTNVLVTNDNALGTPVTDDPSSFVLARLTNALLPPEPGYAQYFESASTSNALIKCIELSTRAYRLDFSGTITATNPANTGGFLIVKAESSLGLGNVFTGGTKPYPLGPGKGGNSSSVGFNLTVYGEVANGEVIALKVASNEADTLTVTDLIVIATLIKPA